ncbi:MAG: hypothetical protein U1F36_18670 [Planctomycetota bacterium]
MSDRLVGLLREVEGRIARPAVRPPDVEGLRARARRMRLQRAAGGLLLLVLLGFGLSRATTSWFVPTRIDVPRVWRDPLVIADLERAAAARFGEALRSPERVAELRRIVTVYPDTITAQRAGVLLSCEESR